MPKKVSTVIVIDCSIAHAAGPQGASHPTSKHCRDFLLAVLQICHRIGMSPAVSEEWKHHRSSFARQWLVSMHARKKVSQISTAENPAMRDALLKSTSFESAIEAMLKDAHLLEAAIESDKRIASLDERVRKLFSVAARQCSPIHGVCWVNPDLEFDEILNWLSSGAPLEKARFLESQSDH